MGCLGFSNGIKSSLYIAHVFLMNRIVLNKIIKFLDWQACVFISISYLVITRKLSRNYEIIIA